MPSLSEMRSVSVLEQRVETTGVSQAAADLDRLAAAQKGAAAGANDLAIATDTATKRVTSLREQAERQWLSLDKGALAAKKYADEVAKVSRFQNAGALGSGDAAQTEADKRIALARARYERERAALNDNIKRGGGAQSALSGTQRALSGFQMTNLGYQANDIVSGLMMGQSPSMIAAQQGGQVLQILQSSSKGAGAAIMEVGGIVGRFLINPLTLAAGAIGATTAAWYQYSVAQDAAARSLQGLGRASGLTLSSLNSIADQTKGMSHSAALAMAGTYAGAGLNGGLVGSLTGSATKKYADFTSQSLGDASAELAKAFQDPVRGLDSLNSKMGFLDASTRETVRSFLRQGDVMAAQRTAFDAFNKSIDQVVSRKGAIRSTWEAIWNVGSSAVTAVGSIGTPLSATEEVERARKNVENLQKMAEQNKRFGSVGLAMPGGGRDEIGPAKDRLFDAQEMLRAQGIMDQITRANGESERSRSRGLQGDDAIRATLPELDALQKLIDKQKLLDEVRKDTNAHLSFGADAAARAYDAVRLAVETTLSTEQRLQQSGALAVQGIMARTLAEKAGIAVAQARLDMAGKEIDSVQRKLTEQNALNRVMAEGNRLLVDATRAANDRAGLLGLDPLARALKENDYKYRDLREQTGGLSGATTMPGATINTTGLNSAFEAAIKKLISEFPSVKMTSGFRTQEEQDRLYANRFSNPYPVAKHSLHSQGLAADLSIPGGIRSDVVARAAQLGMVFPLKNDPVHAVFKGGQQAMQDVQAQVKNGGASTPYAKDRNSILDEAMGVDLKRQSDELDRQNQLWKIRAGMVGQGDDAIDRAIKMQELFNEAGRKGITVSNVGTEAYARYTIGLGALADKSMVAEKMQKELQRTVQQMDLLRDVSKGALSSFTGDLIAGRSAAEALQHSLQGVLSKLLDMAENQLIASLFGKTGGLGGGLLGSLLGFGGGGVGAGGFSGGLGQLYANGGVFGPSGVHAFALGGAFSNSIVNRPTLFPFANGTGLMGEAGPEAIMPLRRGPDGRLGVSGAANDNRRSQTGGAVVQPVININNAPSQPTVSTGRNGEVNIDFYIETIENRMAQRMSRGRGVFKNAKATMMGAT